MNKVIIEQLKIKTCHGVNPPEKKHPQTFLFSAEIETDFFAAAHSDEVSKTISYSTVCKLIRAAATEKVYNLIETLAYVCAERILENFSAAKAVTVRVDKPQAPVSAKFKTVAVEVRLERTIAYIALGSSVGNKKGLLDFAVKQLILTRGISVNKVSEYIESQPYGGAAKNQFLNACAEIETYLPPHALLAELHRIEDEGGRVRDVRWGDRTLDLDIIFYGNRIIREEGLIIPHADYINRDFVKTPLKEIAPEFICPDCGKKVKDLT